MDFKDQITQLAERISKQKDVIQTEEATKNAFIMPMIAVLGYDVFNPFEVVPEMDCDLTRKGDRIDYAIKKDNATILLIECKHCGQNLDLHNTQLAKYYAASNARFGILTNGIEYRFYADLDKINIMDKNPFLIVNMLNLSDNVIEQLKKFHKSYYNESDILSTAQELQITIQIKDLLIRNFQNPGEDFTRYFIRCLNDGKSTAKQVELYKPILKKSIASVINDIISDRLNVTIKNEGQEQQDKESSITSDTNHTTYGVVYSNAENGIATTQEEIDAYNIIRSILHKYISDDKILYKDFKSYFAIGIENPSYWWICRLAFGQRNKSIYFPAEGYKSQTKVNIDTIDDIFKYADKIEQCFKQAQSACKNWKNKHQNR
ncbi:type I restriction enzyme HsdR N-terminal domain-containing protein [Parabacteroides sp. AGMB00274]|uniref:Type I restriction enzyme HsdR N-terminal domain-containing protein n=1 Tax=Parabacteroides faecalis TaxID=2924040 RepID=A0ABT0C2R5_9BACT|nr:type I restriction endonuclease [Parabacteroides faecalis]MCJ2381292.1 type I restriction enzyme HsdR N-terminal domain-containing protein [Parabacteroides faecalis]